MTDDPLFPVRDKLARLRRNVAAALALDGAARVALVLLAAVAASFLLDRVFKLETPARAVLLIAAAGGLGWVGWRFLFCRLRGVPGEEPLAIAVEARFPGLGDRLISALQLARVRDPERYGMSNQLIEDVIADVAEPARDLEFREVVATARVARMALFGLLALLLLGAGAAADPESAGIWFQRNVLLRDVRWPQKTYLEVDPERFPDGAARIVRGADLVVTARSVGEVHPERVTIHWEDSEGDRGKATMKADLESHLYRHKFREIGFPLRFHLEGGDDVTDTFRIELLDPPEVTAFEIEIAFPDYAGRKPVRVDLAAGDPEMLRGGAVTIRGESSKPLDAAQLVLGEAEGDALDARIAEKTGFSLTFRPSETVLAGIRLRDTDGLSNPSLAPRFLVRVLDDRAPRVRLAKEGIGTMVVTGAVVPWVLRVTDDVKVVAGRIEIAKSSGEREAPEPHRIALDAAALGREAVELRGTIELSELDLSPGAFLAFEAYASDNAKPEAHEGRSDPFTVKVVTLEELSSELLRRQQEQRKLFEELIQREKRLYDRFLDLRDAPPASAAELRTSLESEGREQREIARRVHAIERALRRILDEMLNNRITTEGRVRELRDSVAGGLEWLRVKVMPHHADRLEEAARSAESFAPRGADGDGIRAGYDEVLAAMQAVLGRMEKAESFTEIIEQVGGILDRHRKLTDATKRRYEEELKKLFGR